MAYDLKNSDKYVNVALQMCKGMGENKKFPFIPTRESSILCYCKFDTETAGQIFFEHKVRKKMPRKESCTMNGCGKLPAGFFSGYKFRYEISTDGVGASVLFSRGPGGAVEGEQKFKGAENSGALLSKQVGVDLGRKNVITAVDRDSVSEKYSSRQRMFESKTYRFREVLKREGRRRGIGDMELPLTCFDSKMVDYDQYRPYAVMKQALDQCTASFYRGGAGVSEGTAAATAVKTSC